MSFGRRGRKFDEFRGQDMFTPDTFAREAFDAYAHEHAQMRDALHPEAAQNEAISVLWHPTGFDLPTVAGRALSDVSHGATPSIRFPVRLIGVDVPEAPAQTASAVAKVDQQLLELAQWIRNGKVKVARTFADYVLPRLEGGNAAAKQAQYATEAALFMKENTHKRLALPSGRKRELLIRTAEEPFDFGHKLLVYVAPRYTKRELRKMTRRDRSTFNLDLIAAGWAAPFIFYPNIPGEADLPLLIEASSRAIDGSRGIWRDFQRLMPYEFRMLCMLHDVTKQVMSGKDMTAEELFGWRSRYCVDMRSLIVHSYDNYHAIPPQYRLWVWRRNLRKAISDLNLRPSANLVM